MNAQIYREASDWLIEFRMDEADASARRRFEAWLERSPEHVRAYLELTAVWEDSSQLDAERALDIDALIALARAEANVFELDSDEPVAKPLEPIQKSRTRRFALAASILLTVWAGVLGYGYWNKYQRGSYVTDIGQQRTLTLPDGTTVELNAGTRLRERYTVHQRTVELLEGQALFRVAKNPSRPFVVISDIAAVRAVGTQFDVYRRKSGTTVTVIEGRVAVRSKAAGSDGTSRAGDARHDRGAGAAEPGEILLNPGQQLNIEPRIAAQPVTANLAMVTAWTQQKLVFESASLTEVAEQFNRYNSRKLVVDLEGLQDFRVNGTFPALDPGSLSRMLSFLREQPGIALDEREHEIRIVKK